MKTPREILLERHKSAEPRLDTVRRAVMGSLNNKETRKQRMDLVAWLLGCSETFWRELIWPSRRIWAGIVAAWVVIVVVNFHDSRNTGLAGHTFTPPSPAVLMAWREQELWLADFAAPRETRDADRPKKAAPTPHSEWHNEFLQA